MKTFRLDTLDKLGKVEERMIRAMMPRTSASDPAPLPVFTNSRPAAKKTFTWKLGEVARVNAS